MILFITTLVKLFNATSILAMHLTGLLKAVSWWVQQASIKHVPLFEAISGLIS